jgi:hypothetical protein
MIDAGIFRTDLEIAALNAPDERRPLHDVMVDTGIEYNWVPRDILIDLGVSPVRVDRFETADGRVLEREVGFALLFAAGRSAAAAVVFAGERDLVLLGAHGLEGLNLRVDLGRKELVPAGPVPAAAA